MVPAFVLDDAILSSDFARPNRVSFLMDALLDLDRSLRRLGARLIVRRGDVVEQAMALMGETGAELLYVSADVSAYARVRERRLARACAERGLGYSSLPGTTVVPPAEIVPAGGDHFRVFTPYFRKWQAVERRPLARVPERLSLPEGLDAGRIPDAKELVDGATSPDLPAGGASEGRARASRWLDEGLAHYADRHDDLGGDDSSRLSPWLHFGCLSPLELATEASSRDGGDAFVRQLCWRDFHHQVHSATPDLPREDYRTHGDRWRSDDAGLQAWKDGRTGYPIVDAGMRQLRAEGWMHNRARLITASFLVKDLYIDWRLGAQHFWDLLVDGDMANNSGNWQWVAGTGNDTRPNRVFNPLRQAERFDPQGDYVRRYVPELAAIEGSRVHRPWDLGLDRSTIDYPEPILDHAEAAAEFRRRRSPR